MLKRIICLLLGHGYKQEMEYYGTLENGNKTYKAIVGNCIRCNKKYRDPIVRTNASE